MTKLLWMLPVVGILSACQQPLVPADHWVQQVATGYRFTEGPAADADGQLYFTDIPNERIIRFDPATGRTYVFRENTGKANGLMWHDGCLYMAEGGNRRVTKLCDGELTVLATSHPFGRRLNSPNDVAVDGDGGVYFTDPRYGDRKDMEMTVEGVYYITPGGEVDRLIDDLVRPNGVVLSPRGNVLYVADHGAKTIYAYDVIRPGKLGERRFFAAMNHEANGGPDGMTVDLDGRVYAAGQGAVWVWDNQGRLVTQIPVPEEPANVTFGGKGDNTLYITARKSLYRIELNARGAR